MPCSLLCLIITVVEVLDRAMKNVPQDGGRRLRGIGPLRKLMRVPGAQCQCDELRNTSAARFIRRRRLDSQPLCGELGPVAHEDGRWLLMRPIAVPQKA